MTNGGEGHPNEVTRQGAFNHVSSAPQFVHIHNAWLACRSYTRVMNIINPTNNTVPEKLALNQHPHLNPTNNTGTSCKPPSSPLSTCHC